MNGPTSGEIDSLAEPSRSSPQGRDPRSGTTRSLAPAGPGSVHCGELDCGERLLLRRLYHYGHSPGEVAEMLGIPVDTVESLARSAKRALRSALDVGHGPSI